MEQNPPTVWRRQPQEQPGDYFFDGKLYATATVMESLSKLELSLIIKDLQEFVAKENGVDYLQVYLADDGRKIFCIDQLSRSMIESGQYTPEQLREYHHATIMFAEEY